MLRRRHHHGRWPGGPDPRYSRHGATIRHSGRRRGHRRAKRWPPKRCRRSTGRPPVAASVPRRAFRAAGPATGKVARLEKIPRSQSRRPRAARWSSIAAPFCRWFRWRRCSAARACGRRSAPGGRVAPARPRPGWWWTKSWTSSRRRATCLRATDLPGLLGSAVVGGRVTDFLDLDTVARCALGFSSESLAREARKPRAAAKVARVRRAGRRRDEHRPVRHLFRGGHYLGVDVLEVQEVLREQRLTPCRWLPPRSRV